MLPAGNATTVFDHAHNRRSVCTIIEFVRVVHYTLSLNIRILYHRNQNDKKYINICVLVVYHVFHLF